MGFGLIFSCQILCSQLETRNVKYKVVICYVISGVLKTDELLEQAFDNQFDTKSVWGRVDSNFGGDDFRSFPLLYLLFQHLLAHTKRPKLLVTMLSSRKNVHWIDFSMSPSSYFTSPSSVLVCLVSGCTAILFL